MLYTFIYLKQHNHIASLMLRKYVNDTEIFNALVQFATVVSRDKRKLAASKITMLPQQNIELN